MSSVELEAPARAEYVSLLRMLAASLATSRRQLDEERVDNLKLAVSEACTILVEARGSESRRMTITWQEDDDGVNIDVDDGRQGIQLSGSDGTDEASAMPFRIIRALVDDVSFVTDDGKELLRMRMVCAPV